MREGLSSASHHWISVLDLLVFLATPALFAAPPALPDHTPSPAEIVMAADEDRISIEARRVAYCESGFRAQAKSPHSTASGYFQFLDGTWEWVTDLPAPARDYPLEVQLAAFESLWDGGAGRSHWQPSEHCWRFDAPWEVMAR